MLKLHGDMLDINKTVSIKAIVWISTAESRAVSVREQFKLHSLSSRAENVALVTVKHILANHEPVFCI
jgi:hypothetical protein